MFRMVDVSGDGAVSKQELAARGWGDVMAEMDTDGSGEIDFPEFDAMVRIWTDVSDLISDAEFGFNWITPRLIMPLEESDFRMCCVGEQVGRWIRKKLVLGLEVALAAEPEPEPELEPVPEPYEVPDSYLASGFVEDSAEEDDFEIELPPPPPEAPPVQESLADVADEQRLAAERAEQERLAAEMAEQQERLAVEEADQQRLVADKAEQERLAAQNESVPLKEAEVSLEPEAHWTAPNIQIALEFSNECARKSFGNIDKDGTGSISHAEVNELAQRMEARGHDPKPLLSILKLLDTDGSGEIEFDEWQHLWSRLDSFCSEQVRVSHRENVSLASTFLVLVLSVELTLPVAVYRRK